jgi:hypothetical protein
MTVYDDEGEKPLDPAAERLRRKMVRLLFVSGGIMLLGLIAVFASIVYKLNERGADASESFSAGSPVEAEIAIPAGHRIVSTSLGGDRVLITLAAPDGSTSLLLIDLKTGATLGRYATKAEP